MHASLESPFTSPFSNHFFLLFGEKSNPVSLYILQQRLLDLTLKLSVAILLAENVDENQKKKDQKGKIPSLTLFRFVSLFLWETLDLLLMLLITCERCLSLRRVHCYHWVETKELENMRERRKWIGRGLERDYGKNVRERGIENGKGRTDLSQTRRKETERYEKGNCWEGEEYRKSQPRKRKRITKKRGKRIRDLERKGKRLAVKAKIWNGIIGFEF